VPDLRLIFPNGSLIFPPFPNDRYRHDVHTAIYRCKLKSTLGGILSREVHVKAVVKQKYDIQVHDEYVIAGNTAVLKCKVPNYVSDYVMVTSWIQDDNINIYPNTDIGGKYVVLSNGDLYISNAGPGDGYKNYACRTVHRLTGEVKASVYPGRIIVTEPKGNVQPRVTVDKFKATRISIGDDVTLPCVAQGYPVPGYYWKKELDGQMVPVALGERITLLSAGLLRISKIQLEDRGVYLCFANNSVGEESVRVTLEVSSPLSVHVQPQVQIVDVGKTANFQCIINGYPIARISWMHNGKPIAPDSRVEVLNDPPRLTVKELTKEDRGMYQCFATNNWDQAQATAELNMGDASPELIYWFSEQTLQPGPTVSLKCVASGNPPPQFTWTLDGFPIPDHPRFLVGQYVTIQDDVISHVNITNIKAEDGGEYSCIAHNSVGKVTHSARVNVYGLPYIRVMPKITGIAGSSLVIKCPVAGYPIESVTWEKDGQILPLNRRQRVYQNGTLVVEQAQRREDAGTYTCQAQNRQRNSARRDVEVQIIVPPKILPINPMTDLLREGMRAAITCQIMEGDLPINFRWERNGQVSGYVGRTEKNKKIIKPPPSQSVINNAALGTVIRRIDEFSSSLIIDQVSSKHTGNYTCIASNVAGLEKYIVPLTVNDNDDQQTKIINQVRTTISGLRKFTNYSITVLAYTGSGDGVRSPSVFCQTEEDVPSAPSDIKAVLSAPNKILVSWLPPKFSNGPLTGYTFYMSVMEDGQEEGTHKRALSPFTDMHEVIRAHDTSTLQFWVTASTRIGEGESTKIITVTPSKNVPAKIASFGREVVSAWKQDILLHCRKVGIPLPSINWRVNDKSLEVGGRRFIMPNGTLIIKDIQSVDQANYSCAVENQYGRDDIIYSLKVIVPPEPPILKVVDSFTDSLHLRWSDQGNGGSPILGYVINYKRDHGDWEELQIPARTDDHMLRNLWCGSRYLLYITAFNRIGTGLPSDIVTTHTKGTVPVQPKQSQMLTMNATVATIWLDSWGDGGCGILYFSILYRAAHHSAWITASNHIKPTERIYSITDLVPATEYRLKVSAHNNAGDTEMVYNFTTLTFAGVVPELSPPVSHSVDQSFYFNMKVMLPMLLSIVVLALLIATLFWRRRVVQDRNSQEQTLHESPSIAQIQNKQNRDQQYLAVRAGRGPQPLDIDDTYKPESSDYIEDICPYATFQLSKPTYSESSYSGNVYSGPYHSNKEPEYTKVRRKGGRLRDPHSESQESDNLGSTDSEVKKILTLHLPISEYDTLGSDSEADARAVSQELMSFGRRMRGGAEGSSSSSESPPSGSVGRKPYNIRKGKGKGGGKGSRHVRSSSGYSSHNEETTFSISHTASFNERIHPPTRFSDISMRDFSENDYEKDHKPRGVSKLTREAFQINV
ncbi:hypothetical protein GWI33_013511, partial [Rhynchophorus ferrugineus]